MNCTTKAQKAKRNKNFKKLKDQLEIREVLMLSITVTFSWKCGTKMGAKVEVKITSQ